MDTIRYIQYGTRSYVYCALVAVIEEEAMNSLTVCPNGIA
jgi:hypothetical protein